MPTASEDITVASGRTVSTVTIPVERSIIKCASVIDIAASLDPNDTYAELGIMSGGISAQHKVGVLASGYLGQDTPVSWTGSIITEADMYIYARIRSTDGGKFRLTALVTPYKVSPEGGLILDP